MAFESLMLPIRGVQLLLAIICLGLSAYESSLTLFYFDGSDSHGFSEANYNVFTSVWTILLLAYFIVVSMRPAFGHKWAILGLDALTMLFWFAAFICIAVVEGDIAYIWGDHAYRAAIALAVFGAFEWLLFVVTTVLDVLNRNSTVGSTPKTSAAPMQGV